MHLWMQMAKAGVPPHGDRGSRKGLHAERESAAPRESCGFDRQTGRRRFFTHAGYELRRRWRRKIITRFSACRAPRAPMRSRRRTASWRCNFIPTGTRTTRKPKTSLRKLPRLTKCCSDQDKRARFDRYGVEGIRQGVDTHGFQDVNDIFSSFGDIFGGSIFEEAFGAQGQRQRSRQQQSGPQGTYLKSGSG